jgi:ParB family chromosome partitioning protein
MLEEGLAECPAYILDGVTTTDEIRFNQIHNASDIDTMDAPLYVPAQPVANTWAHVAPDDLRGNLRTKNAARKSEILRLLAKHGEWGSAVVTQSGEVLASGLYSVCCAILHLPIRVYVVRDNQREDVLRYFGQSYGQFSYDHLPKTTWAQSLAQLMRLRNEDSGKGKSRTYESTVLPLLRKHPAWRVLDFGAGQMDYVKKLRTAGYHIRGLEFYFRRGKQLDVRAVHRDIDALCSDLRAHGRYDLVVCDSVLNSVDTVQAERDVMACLNALCAPGGLIVFSGRNRDYVDYIEQELFAITDTATFVHFIDDHGFSAHFSSGVWRYQKYHRYHEVAALAEHYVGAAHQIRYADGSAVRLCDFAAVRGGGRSSWVCVGHKAGDIDTAEAEAALSREFNLPLPDGRTYARSADIVDAWHAARERDPQHKHAVEAYSGFRNYR